MQKIWLNGIFVKLDIRINSNQKFWAEAEQTTSLNSYCNTWIEGEWFRNLLTQKYFTKKFSHSKVFDLKFVWTKIVLNQNFVWKMWKKTSEPVKKTFEVILNEKIQWGRWNLLLTTNVRNRQFVEDILANRRACAGETMTHLRKVTMDQLLKDRISISS